MKIAHLAIGAAALFAAVTVQAGATTMMDDPLHAFCVAPDTCSDNGTITPVANSSPNFGFTKSPDSGTGDFWLYTLIPDNTTNASSQTIMLNGTNTANASVTGSLTGSGWTSGDLATYLGISASPANPIGAFLPSTQAQDAGATGYQVYGFDFGNVTFGALTDPTFSESYAFPAGSVIVGFFNDGSGTWVATANSSALETTGGGGGGGGGNPPPGVPEPATLAFAGTALLALAFLRRRKNTV